MPRGTALVNGASKIVMAAITVELARPDSAVTFTRLCEASTPYYAFFRLLISQEPQLTPQLSKKYHVIGRNYP